MNFTVIDFETANSKRASACALGIVKVQNGKIVDKKDWLIRPNDMLFNGMNISIHGIRPKDVINKPEFNDLYNLFFKPYLENQLVIAHNASFDVSVLRNSLDLYSIPYPTFDYLCTVKIAQKVWPELLNHKLNTLSDFFNFEFKHHDALDDCLACANIMIEALKKCNCSSANELSKILGIKTGKLYPNGYSPCSCSKR